MLLVRFDPSIFIEALPVRIEQSWKLVQKLQILKLCGNKVYHMPDYLA